MSLVLDVLVPGEPVGTLYKATMKGGHASIYMPGATKEQRAAGLRGPREAMTHATGLFRVAWHGQAAESGPMIVEVECLCGRPKYLQKLPGPRSEGSPKGRIPCLTRPDLSNCCKLYEDALKDAGVLSDDCIVVEIHAFKEYVALVPAEQPRTRVKVYRWTPRED